MKLNVLSVSLPAMGGYKIGGIHNRIIPDVLTFISQKQSVISIHTDESSKFLLAALGVGMTLQKMDYNRQRNNFQTKIQTGFGKKQLISKLKRFSNSDMDFENSSNKKWTFVNLSMLAKTATLIPYNMTDAEHVNVITSMKGLFSVRFYCYACHKRFSTVKHLCAASSCTECRMPKCRNRASTPFNTNFLDN